MFDFTFTILSFLSLLSLLSLFSSDLCCRNISFNQEMIRPCQPATLEKVHMGNICTQTLVCKLHLQETLILGSLIWA